MTEADINRVQAQTAELLEVQLRERQRKIEAERQAKAAERARRDEHYRQAKAKQAGVKA